MKGLIGKTVLLFFLSHNGHRHSHPNIKDWLLLLSRGKLPFMLVSFVGWVERKKLSVTEYIIVIELFQALNKFTKVHFCIKFIYGNIKP